MRITKAGLGLAMAAALLSACGETKSVTDAREQGPQVSLAGGAGGSAAAFTSIDPAHPETCLNGGAVVVNCNRYTGKPAVYLNGGPVSATLDAGTYFWAILTPGSQNGGYVDGAEGNLSDATAGGTTGDNGIGDPVANRTFTITADGAFSYAGGHATLGAATEPLVQLINFDDTDNNGLGYILAICSVATADTPVQCKYDAFKIVDPNGGGVVVDEPPAITKDANGTYDETVTWSIAKAVVGDAVKSAQKGGSVTFDYAVTVTRTGSTLSNYEAAGVIKVTNFNDAPITGATVTDVMTGAESCTVDGGVDITLDPGLNTFTYACTYGAAVPPASVTNTATVTWGVQGSGLAAGSASFDLTDVQFTRDQLLDASVTVTDVFNGGAPISLSGAVDNGDGTYTYSYSKTVTVTTDACTEYTNVASFETSDTKTTGSSPAVTVTACGPETVGLTIGFWQNKNGQDVIKGQATSGPCPVVPFLTAYNPYKSLVPANATSITCKAAADSVLNIVKSASAAGAAMNAMLRAQMLATALSVYYSQPLVRRIPVPSPAYPGLGTVKINLTQMCLTTGPCSGPAANNSAAFGGAAALTVFEMLTIASNNANAPNGMTLWYDQNKPMQEKAKNAFDVINNKMAFVAP